MNIRTKTARVAILVMIATLSAQGTAHAVPAYKALDTWLHCPGTARVSPVDYAEAGSKDTVIWDTTPPPPGNRDCLVTDNARITAARVHDFFLAGTFTGNLNRFTFRGFLQYPMAVANPSGPVTVGVGLTIDGKRILGTPSGHPAGPTTVTVRPVPQADGTSSLVQFTVDNLKVGAEEGFGTKTHDITFGLDYRAYDGAVWFLDSASHPSQINFNPPLDTTILVIRP